MKRMVVTCFAVAVACCGVPFAVRDAATGLAPASFEQRELGRAEFDDRFGTHEERCAVDGYDVDAVLAASNEFRRSVPGSGAFRWMCRGEAIHIARALGAVRAEKGTY